MCNLLSFAVVALVLSVGPFRAFAQAPPGSSSQPMYEVTIVSRTTKALNYGYLSAPTRIGFLGTPVASAAKGEATIEPKRGSTMVRLRVENLPEPGRFGSQFLTYVAWAISPEGRAHNLGEIILDGSQKGKLSTSTPLQTFAMIITAEPYYSVSQPSDIVVMENVVTRDTIGKVQEVNATYELLPRKPYTFDTAAKPAASGAPPVSQERYEAILALYQALNAIQIAQSQGADKHASKQMARARELYNKAREYPAHLSKEVVSMAREATQIAEDGRAIAAKRSEAEAAAADAGGTAEGARGRQQ
ncbi:MAG TPA: hypothetical protein VER03_03390 [Bryobacteraceae bacterium]|nr:hypothetical protein [Bryobacteraceae bacterium]